MERCTIRLKTGEARCAQLDGNVVVERLAAYEDTGLMPEEIAARRWIPVTERLPDADTEVLLISKGWGDRLFYVGFLHPIEAETSWLTGIESKPSDWTIWGWSYLKEPNVTHWMPLPEAPEVE